MAVDVVGLRRDLAAESEDLFALLEPLPLTAWDLPTPAQGWSIRDQVAHLAYFDEAARAAMVTPDRFRIEAAAVMSRGTDFAAALARDHRAAPVELLLPWFRQARAALLEALAATDPRHRMPWYGPPMGVASNITARLMETWAHGQDVADALGVERAPTRRLRHIADLGVRTRGFSYAVRGLEPPAASVRVTLTPPDAGDPPWVWGEDDGQATITGPALDFCLVVTQRRHVADTALEVVGEAARGWMERAQAFAGPPSRGPAPGERPAPGQGQGPGAPPGP